MLLSERFKTVVSLFFLLIITVVVFLITVEMRAPWMKDLSSGHHQWLSGSTIKFANNWYSEGPVSLKFGLIENPKSIEFPSLSSRQPYASYPPGTILPIYLLAKIKGDVATPEMLMQYNRINHFFIALLLSLTVFLFLRQIRFDYLNSIFLSTVPVLIEFFTPATMYWHQNVFFADQAIILPFVLFIFFEIIKADVSRPVVLRTIFILQAMVMFYGALTDWLFVFISLTVWANRLLKGEMGKSVFSVLKLSLLFWLPFIFAMGLFVVQLYSLDILHELIPKLLFRTGFGAEGGKYIDNFFKKFWLGHIQNGYGTSAVVLLWGSLLLLLVGMIVKMRNGFSDGKENMQTKTLSLISYYIVPCFLQIYFLRNHSLIHDFSALKFSIPLAVIPFVLAPILIISFWGLSATKIYIRTKIYISGSTFRKPGSRTDKKIYLVSFSLPLVLFITLMNDKNYYTKFYPEANPEYRTMGDFISHNTGYSDVIFSNVYAVPINPPQQLSYSMKRVYKIEKVDDVYEKVKDINGSFTINILIPREVGLAGFLEKLEPMVFHSGGTDKYSIFKINGREFLDIYPDKT